MATPGHPEVTSRLATPPPIWRYRFAAAVLRSARHAVNRDHGGDLAGGGRGGRRPPLIQQSIR